MSLNQVAVIGLGLIGGSLARDLRRLNLCKKIIGVDSSPKHRSMALQLQLVDEVWGSTTTENGEVEFVFDAAIEEKKSLPQKNPLQNCDLVVLAIPVTGIEKLLPQILDKISATSTVIDMGSTKLNITRQVSQHPQRSQFVAVHPMAGTEHSGPAAALEELFYNKTVVLCDAEKSGVLHLEKVKSLFQTLHSRLVYMSSADHDLHVAYVSHLSHISSFVLAQTVLKKEKNEKAIFDLAAGGFESTVRLAKSAPSTWAPIFAQNRQHVLEAVEAYLQHLTQFRDDLKNQKDEALVDFMQQAGDIRRVLLQINNNKNNSTGV